MPIAHPLLREGSRTRLIHEALKRHGPMTLAQIAVCCSVQKSWVCKCLRILENSGYVRRGGFALNRKGLADTRLPVLFEPTPRELPSAAHPVAPTPTELCDIMNQIIRRSPR